MTHPTKFPHEAPWVVEAHCRKCGSDQVTISIPETYVLQAQDALSARKAMAQTVGVPHIIAKQLAVPGNGPTSLNGLELWTGFQEHTPTVYPSAEAASDAIKAQNLPLGWVRVPLSTSSQPREVAAVEAATVEEVESDMLRDDVSRLSRIVGEIRSLVADLYSDRGEDERTGEVCRAVLALCKQA